MKVINIFGGPGAGKSTIAAGLFYEMKRHGYSVELIGEYAKQMLWDERDRMFDDQLYIFAKQHHKQDMLKGKVDYCITDSPLLLSLVYAPPDYHPSFHKLVKEVWKSFGNINFFIGRTHPYQSDGRYQDEIEADSLALSIQEMLVHNDRFHGFMASEKTHLEIFDLIKNGYGRY